MRRLIASFGFACLALSPFSALAAHTECRFEAKSLTSGYLLDTGMILSDAMKRLQEDSNQKSMVSLNFDLPNAANEIKNAHVDVNASDSYEIIATAGFDLSGRPRFSIRDFHTPYKGTIREELILDTRDASFSAVSAQRDYRGVSFSIVCALRTGH